ncbi:hypothetical protein QJU23_10065 [Pasteurella atlantica]|uniref:Uncharacterized protein n=2 Tax=Pasteurellaceae TaxID=712 RepID=A0ACC6HPE0_9PAST|nr:hypothetical protein [Pasteurella atlantica]MDP8052755.1 hypothetical protein [Pasteurella atlantica]MDP8106052.1 hypothetical protein [Pasteurella atlantica]MDP8149441.1 hypothetical protein [Pasteurella atlantica]
MKKISYLLIVFSLVTSNTFAQKKQCLKQTNRNHNALICSEQTELFEHNIYSLIVDNQLIFSLVDDFVDNVRLTHTIPRGLVMELPLSEGKTGKISLTGGCIPVSKKGMEVSRLCNFFWGKVKIIHNARFKFE